MYTRTCSLFLTVTTCAVCLQVRVYCHEGEGEGSEHLDSMDLHDVKSELERDAEKAEVRREGEEKREREREEGGRGENGLEIKGKEREGKGRRERE